MAVNPMTIKVEATYENGVLKPVRPLPFKEHERVQITVVRTTAPTGAATDEDAEAMVRRSAGILLWTGDRETVQRLAIDPDLDPQEET
jgi:predicted DNA-binding antitoxin AbrB/MazE fold protein